MNTIITSIAMLFLLPLCIIATEELQNKKQKGQPIHIAILITTHNDKLPPSEIKEMKFSNLLQYLKTASIFVTTTYIAFTKVTKNQINSINIMLPSVLDKYLTEKDEQEYCKA